MKESYFVDERGFYGEFGGAYVPEILYKCVHDLQEAYLLCQLPLDLLRDDALHPRHQVGVRVRPHRRADDVKSVGGMAAPVADGLRAGIAQRHITRTDGMHLGSQHLHTLHVRVLTLHIGGTHKHLALHVHQRTDRRCGHTVLSGASLCDDAGLAHLLGQQDLADGVVDLVGTRVVQVFTLQIELTAVVFTHALGIVERRRAAHIVLQQLMVLLLELLRLDDRQGLPAGRAHTCRVSRARRHRRTLRKILFRLQNSFPSYIFS